MKEQNQGRSRGLVVCEAEWRSSRAGHRVGPEAGGVYPTQGPYGSGLPASVAAAVRHRHRVPAVPATARCSAVPGAPACLCAARGPSPVQAGLPESSLMPGGQLQDQPARELRLVPAQGRGARGTQACPPPSLKEKRVPGPMAVSVKTDVLTPWLPTAGSHSNIATKTLPAQKATSEFSLPASVALPGQDPVYSKQQEIGVSEVHTPGSTFSTPCLGSLPKVGAGAPGLPAPSQGQASWDAAQPTHHGDSRRSHASAGSGCLDTGTGTRSPGRTSKVGSLGQKTSSRHPSTHRSQWKPRWDSIQAGSKTLGEARLSKSGAHSDLTIPNCLEMHPMRSAGLPVQLPCLDRLSPNT